MIPRLRLPPRSRSLPDAGVLRLHHDPAALPEKSGQVGANRFDDPRPHSLERYVVRYAASTLRGCLLESLDWLRLDPEAAAREAEVVDDAEHEPDDEPRADPAPWAALQEFLQGRHVARFAGARVRVVSINDPRLHAALDREPAVRALLDSAEGRAALTPGRRNLPRMDEAAVRLSTPFGRELTRACSLAVWDQDGTHGIHYRSRHDDEEDCWALFDRAPVQLAALAPFDPPTDHAQRRALQDVAALWGLALPPAWETPA